MGRPYALRRGVDELPRTIREGERFWLLAYVGANGFVQQRINWNHPRDIVDIWRSRPDDGRFAIVREYREGRDREVLSHGVLGIDLSLMSWPMPELKTFQCQRFRNLDQAIMACAMVS